MSIRLLGGFEVCRGAGPAIVFPTRKAKALLALLAQHPGQRRAREALAAMFWPDSAEAQARGSLRQSLKLIRRALEGQGETVIVGDGDALALAPGTVEVDVARFERLHEAGTVEALERAAALYRGDFLEGTTLADGAFAEWSMVEAVRLRERATDVFSRLLAHRADTGDGDGAVTMALRLLALDPLQEHVHRRLMQLYLDQGRRGFALEQYRVCRATLERELGIRPEPETEQLHQRIRRRHGAGEPVVSGAEPVSETGTRPSSRLTDPLLARPAVAVLPFANLSGDPVQAYFSDGLGEDIITALAGWRCFPLIASASTLTCRDERHDVRAVASNLGAAYVVDGSVRRVGRRMRITVRLIESEGGRHLWAERFDLTMRDILAVQDEAAQKIAAIVEPELERAELGRIVARRTADLTAWDHCLQGRSFLSRCTPEGNRLARASFEKALRLDPEYSDAYAGLATSHNWDLLFACARDRAASIARAIETGERAVAHDRDSSAAHLAFGAAQVWAEHFDVAIPETELAVTLNPSNAQARMALGNRLDLIGRTAEGIAQMAHSLQLNPRDPRRFNYMGFLARAHITLGEYEKALEWAHGAVRVRPDHPGMYYRLAVCLAHLDRTQEARAALEDCERLRPGYVASQRRWQPYGDGERNEHFFAGLRRHRLLG